jgi:TolB-like protein/DNA-binding winged helix-turn-helix (wHTH) protein
MRYGFGPYSLDIEERHLKRGSQRIRLEPKAFDVLRYLVEHDGHLVDKQTLIDAIWPTVAIGDNSLTRCIHQIRGKLGDSAEDPEYLETERGSGYRFIAAVRKLPEEDVVIPRISRSTRWAVTTVAVLTIVAMSWAISGLIGTGDAAVRRLAVLPLENFSGDAEQEYFVDGVHEALIAELSHISQIDVISRSSVLAYRRGEAPLQEIASALDVDTILEGSVARDDQSLTVSVELIQIEPERHLWARRFHRDVADVFEITTGIARDIASEVADEMGESAQTLFTSAHRVDPEAYDRYLLARSLHRQNPPDSSERAIALYHEAIAADPDFAQAYVGLANAIGSAIVFGLLEPAENIPRVRELASTALAVDSTLASAHLVNAAVNFYGYGDVITAETEARRALGLDPSYAGAYKLIAEVYAVTARPEAAWSAIERGRSLDPIPPVSRFKPVFILYLSRSFDRARELALEELAADDDFWQGHWLHCMSSSALALNDEAVAACKRAVSVSRRTPMALAGLGLALARAGATVEAADIAVALAAMRESRYVSASHLAQIHAALGETDLAMTEMLSAYEEGDVNLAYIAVAEFFDELRDDPRFDELAERVTAAPHVR